MADLPQFTPVDLLTGFLGSGKTTLLKRLLADPALADTAVLINEFGEVGLDHRLVERITDDMVLLPSGCVCCTVRGELAQSLRDLLSRRSRGDIPAFSRVVIETTGLADPFPILSTLRADPVLRHHYRPGRVVTTVDAVNGPAQLDTYVESSRQVAIADRLVITKTDLAGAGSLAALTARLARLNPDAERILAGPDIRPAALLSGEGTSRSDTLQSPAGFHCEESRLPGDGDGGSHAARFASFAITVDRPVDWTGFGIWLSMLVNRHGARLLRMKGILALEGEPRPVAVHSVQHLVHTPVHLEAWSTEERVSQLIFIVDGLDADLLKRSFAAFVLARASAAGRTDRRLAAG